MHLPLHPLRHSAFGFQDFYDKSVLTCHQLIQSGKRELAESVRRQFDSLGVRGGVFLCTKDGQAYEVFRRNPKSLSTPYPHGFSPRYIPAAPVRQIHSKSLSRMLPCEHALHIVLVLYFTLPLGGGLNFERIPSRLRRR